MKRITIFTPTYNRKHTLERLYKSLCAQQSKDFIWLVIDDGSTDGTDSLIENFKKEGLLQIQYVYKHNEGLCSGYNVAIEHSTTDLMMCIDSDDYAPSDVIKTILSKWDEYECDRSNIAGLVGLDITPKGEIIGQNLQTGREYNDLVYRKGQPDVKFVVKTDLYKQVAPWPLVQGEKAMNPNFLIMELCRLGYRFIEVNEPLCIVDYQLDGMSHSVWSAYYHSPKSFAIMRRYNIDYGIMPFSRRLVLYIHYNSSLFLSRQFFSKEYLSRFNVLQLLTMPAGWLLSKVVKFKNKK